MPGVGDFDLQAIQALSYRMGDVRLEGSGPDRSTVDPIDADAGDVGEAVQPKGGRQWVSIGQFEMIQIDGRPGIVSHGIFWMGRPWLRVILEDGMTGSSKGRIEQDGPGTLIFDGRADQCIVLRECR